MDLIGRRINNLVVTSKLGAGGMGTVYLCEHVTLGRRVALKLLHPELARDDEVVERFFHEARAANDIRNQHIVDILDFARIETDEGESVYLVMEFLDGESLGHRLKHVGFTPAQVVHVMLQCCDALAASHRAGIVHRDLKPENIYLVRRGDDPDFVKVLDFGIAKLLGNQALHRTRTGMILGTPAYMSPEQCAGRGQIDHRSDIYSLGVVMYELLTGQIPFGGASYADILVAQMSAAPIPPSRLASSVSPELEAVVLRCLEKAPERRFQSMQELAEALRDPAAHLHRTPETGPDLHARATLHLDGAPVVAAAPPGRRRVAFVLAGVFAATTAAFVLSTGILGARLRKAKQAPVACPRPSAPPLDPYVTVAVRSDPPGAEVRRDGETSLGVTPLELRVRRGDPPFELELRRDGFTPLRTTVDTDGATELAVHLAPLPPPARAAAPRPRTPRSSDHLLTPSF